MALLVRDESLRPVWLDEWPLTGRSGFILSDAYRSLRRDLDLYVRNDIAGRSFLVAGHRGAGKTALAARVIEDLRREALQDSVSAHADPSATSPGLQRPLLVRLHGPSLLKTSDKPPRTEAPPGTSPEDTKVRARPKSSKHDRPTPPTTGENPLAQITIALYRSLTREFAEAYAVHAREARRLSPGDQMELAGQFVLELDRAPSPATLRSFWKRLNRLGPGVLWPSKAAKLLSMGTAADQGMRELVALSTAAQAFQVCAGVVEESESELRSRNDRLELKSGATLLVKDLTTRLIGLASGIAVAFGLGVGNKTSIVAGLFAGILVNLTLDISGTRSSDRNRQRSYRFILDHSLDSLDRDLPVVIQRIRDAGLAPVFVVDELDKVSDDHNSLGVFISRLKHLTTDYGFFLFLTDRDYYEYVKRKLSTEAFPVEHTFFSDWIFVLYRPDEFKRFLQQCLYSELGLSPHEAHDDEYASLVLILFLIHRAKLNTVDVIRELSRCCDDRGAVKFRSTELTTRLEFRLAATSQLAIDFILRGHALSSRMESEPIFAQLAVDALYAISRYWEEESKSFKLGRDDLISHLAGRVLRRSLKAGEEAEAILQRSIGQVDIDLLVEQVDRQKAYLCDLARLKADLTADPPGEGLEILDVIPLEHTRAILRTGLEGDDTLEFCFDVFGRALKSVVEPAPEADARPAADRLVDMVDAFAELVAAAGISFEDLSIHSLLPLSTSWDEVLKARQVLASAGSSAEQKDAATALLGGLRSVVEQRGPAIIALLALALRVGHDAGFEAAAASQALAALSRYIDVREAFGGQAASVDSWFDLDAHHQAQAASVSGSMAPRIRTWKQQLDTVQAGLRRPDHLDLEKLGKEAWVRWEKDLRQFLDEEGLGQREANYGDVVLAAAGRLPGRLMRAHPSELTIREWTELSLTGFPAQKPPRERAPYWCLLAGLSALGFGDSLLARLVENRPKASLHESTNWDSTETNGAESGVLILAVDGSSLGVEYRNPRGQAALVVLRSDLSLFHDAIKWLTEQGVFQGVAVESSGLNQASLPHWLRELPAFEFRQTLASSREESSREEVIYGLASIEEIMGQAEKSFGKAVQ